MKTRWSSFLRKVGPLLSAGLLLQAGSCAIDPGTVTGGLLTAVVNSLIASLVYGAFGVPMSGF